MTLRFLLIPSDSLGFLLIPSLGDPPIASSTSSRPSSSLTFWFLLIPSDCLQYLLATFEATTVFTERVNGQRNRTVIFHEDSWVARLQDDGVMDDSNAWSWAYFIAICQMLAISVGLKELKLLIASDCL